MTEQNNSLLFIGKNADLEIIIHNYLVCVLFHNEKKNITAKYVTSHHFGKQLDFLKQAFTEVGITYIPINDINFTNFDFVISIYGQSKVIKDKSNPPKKIFDCAKSTKDELIALGCPADKIIPCTILCDSQFKIEHYKSLIKNPPSFFSNQCFGRYSYFLLGLPFYSPFVNVTISGHDMLKIAGAPKYYLDAPIKYLKNEIINGKDVPIAILGDDIKINLTHYTKFEEFEKVWNNRLKRINFDNIIITLKADSIDEATKFKELPYSKKICFLEEQNSVFGINLDEIDNNIIKVHYQNFKKLIGDNYFVNMPEYDFNSVANYFALRYVPIFSFFYFVMEGKLISYDLETENTLTEYIRLTIWG